MKKRLTKSILRKEAKVFAEEISKIEDKYLFNINDGKSVGTYVEHKLQNRLSEKYEYEKGNSARGIDFPELLVDIKVTSHKQPQSSCPYKSANQKIFGLGYSLLIFVYDKIDDNKAQTSRLNILHLIFIEASRTADYQLTSSIKLILENDGNSDDLIALMRDKNLPIDYDIEGPIIAEKLLNSPLNIGYLTISNALQWRLQYGRVIQKAGKIKGILKIR